MPLNLHFYFKLMGSNDVLYIFMIDILKLEDFMI